MEINIALKNKNYGEYTFHYWLWKNYLDKIRRRIGLDFVSTENFGQLNQYKNEDIKFNTLKQPSFK